VTVELPVAFPTSHPLSDRFGPGPMPAVSAAVPLADWALLALRLRWGFLWNGPPPTDPAVKDPGYGGLTVLSTAIRLRPFAKHLGDSRLAGPWLEVGAGPGLTGSLVRVAGEAGFGWNARWGKVAFGPAVHYLRLLQSANAYDSGDPQLLLVGLEIGLHDSRAESAEAASSTGRSKISDRDGDGIPDDVDKCPDEAEDFDGFEDEDGCPDPDNDHDGINDFADACPNEPETFNGFEDEDGCPDEAPPVVKEERIPLEERVHFGSNRADVPAESRAELAAIVRLWKQHPEWDRLVIDGHADRRGPDDLNLELSRERAEEVYRQLIQLGFAPEKLRIRAYGKRKPRAPGADPEADRENRRVEFVVVKKNGEEIVPALPSAEPVEPPPAPAAGATEPPPLTGK